MKNGGLNVPFIVSLKQGGVIHDDVSSPPHQLMCPSMSSAQMILLENSPALRMVVITLVFALDSAVHILVQAQL